MKKIIKGKLYDTDKARRLGFDGQGDGFSRWYEELYQKRTGEFFLYGEGGPATKYAVSVGQNQWSGGDRIIPLSAAAAREWAEKHLDADGYAGIFGMPEEGDETAALNVQIDAALMARVRERALTDGASLTATVAALLEKGLKSAN